MVTALRRLIRWLFEHLQNLIGWLWQQVAVLWDSFWYWIGEWASEGASWGKSLIPTDILDLFATPLVAANIKNLILATTYFVPVVGLGAIILSTYSLAAVVRLIRWIKSFIPSISG
jgi:hypothetical protein